MLFEILLMASAFLFSTILCNATENNKNKYQMSNPPPRLNNPRKMLIRRNTVPAQSATFKFTDPPNIRLGFEFALIYAVFPKLFTKNKIFCNGFMPDMIRIYLITSYLLCMCMWSPVTMKIRQIH